LYFIDNTKVINPWETEVSLFYFVLPDDPKPGFHRLPPPFQLRSKDGGRRWRSCTSNLTVGLCLFVF
ncbi:hypothetical protein, partial [Bacteroides sp. An19]|uniref:hypothetical protein n=1 Tax=Bacteroides sp. An19 TaxID=1965580 RepID=UPI0019D21DBD